MEAIFEQIVPVVLATLATVVSAIVTNVLIQRSGPTLGIPRVFLRFAKNHSAERKYLEAYSGGQDATSTDLQVSLGAPLSSLQTPLEPASSASTGDSKFGPGDVHLTIGEAFKKYRHILLMGVPGSGKTSLLQYISRAVATESGRSTLGLQRVYLPVLVYLPKVEGNLSLASLIRNSLPEQLSLEMANGFLRPYLESGRCILLFDGLDEVPPEHVQSTIQQIVQLSKTHPSNFIIVTSRPAGLQPHDFVDFEVLQIAQPTLQDSVRAIVDVFLRDELRESHKGQALENEAAYVRAARNARELLVLLVENEHLRDLARDPFWLNLLAIVYRHEGRVPRERTQILNAFCHHYLNFWDRARGVADQLDQATKVRVLSALAFWLQEQNCAVTSRSDTIAVFRHALHDTGKPEDVGDELFQTLVKRSGLIVEYGPDLIGFAHRAFLEFFVAKYLVEQPDYGRTIVERHALDPSWHGVFALWQEMVHQTPESGVVHP